MDTQIAAHDSLGGVSDVLHQVNNALFAPGDEIIPKNHTSHIPDPSQNPSATLQHLEAKCTQQNPQQTHMDMSQHTPREDGPAVSTYANQSQMSSMNYVHDSHVHGDHNYDNAQPAQEYAYNGSGAVTRAVTRAPLPKQCEINTMRPPTMSVHGPGHSCMKDETFELVCTIGQKLNTMEGHLSKLGAIESNVSRINMNVIKLEKDNSEMKSKMNDLETAMQMFSTIYDEHQHMKGEVTSLRHGNDNLLTEIQYLKADNHSIREQCLEQQCRQMENNLLIFGVPEKENEETGVEFLNFLEHHVFTEPCDKDKIYKFKFDRIHRLGPYRKGSIHPRPIVVMCQNFSDREQLRKYQGRIDRKYSIREHFPKDIADRRKKLYPVMRHYLGDRRNRVRLVRDKLYINNTLYVEEQHMNNRPVNRGEHQNMQQHPQYHQQYYDPRNRPDSTYQVSAWSNPAPENRQYRPPHNKFVNRSHTNYEPTFADRQHQSVTNSECQNNRQVDFTTPNPYEILQDMPTNTTRGEKNKAKSPLQDEQTKKARGHSPVVHLNNAETPEPPVSTNTQRKTIVPTRHQPKNPENNPTSHLDHNCPTVETPIVIPEPNTNSETTDKFTTKHPPTNPSPSNNSGETTTTKTDDSRPCDMQTTNTANNPTLCPSDPEMKTTIIPSTTKSGDVNTPADRRRENNKNIAQPPSSPPRAAQSDQTSNNTCEMNQPPTNNTELIDRTEHAPCTDDSR